VANILQQGGTRQEGHWRFTFGSILSFWFAYLWRQRTTTFRAGKYRDIRPDWHFALGLACCNLGGGRRGRSGLLV